MDRFNKACIGLIAFGLLLSGIGVYSGPQLRATTSCVTSPMGTGPGDYLMVPDGGGTAPALKAVYMTSDADVTVNFYLGTSGDHDEIPLTGPIYMKARLPYELRSEFWQASSGKGVWLLRSDNNVNVSGFVTYE